MLFVGAILLLATVARCQDYLDYKHPYFAPDHSVIVHLFEWKWNDIADECERFLGPNGFGGVQVSPPNENLIIKIPERPWWERYQPVSYKLDTRSGNETEFRIMCRRCNAVGVRIYVDAILNHMTGTWPWNVGTGGSFVDFENWYYSGVPYNRSDFNWPPCNITDWFDPAQVRDCQLYGLKDLNQTQEHVIEKLVGYMNNLLDMGVAGFRIDAAKHMWPEDLSNIYGRLSNLYPEYGFPELSRPYLYQEVIDIRDGGIPRENYTDYGDVTEFLYGIHLGKLIREINISSLVTWGGPEWNMMDSEDALVFIDNHDNQRGHGVGGDVVLNYKHRRGYKLAIAFMLAHPFGEPRIMSSYMFNDSDVGPPMDRNENILSPIINPDGSCGGGWVCEHRWPQIYRMVAFRNVVNDTELENWWDNGGGRIAFCRGNMGFIAINNEADTMNERLQTCLPAGIYCDVITGVPDGMNCTGKAVEVDEFGFADIEIEGYLAYRESVFAIHVGFESRLLDE